MILRKHEIFSGADENYMMFFFMFAYRNKVLTTPEVIMLAVLAICPRGHDQIYRKLGNSQFTH